MAEILWFLAELLLEILFEHLLLWIWKFMMAVVFWICWFLAKSVERTLNCLVWVGQRMAALWN